MKSISHIHHLNYFYLDLIFLMLNDTSNSLLISLLISRLDYYPLNSKSTALN